MAFISLSARGSMLTRLPRYKLVWKEASSLFDDMVESEHWTGKSFVDLSPVNEITTKVRIELLATVLYANSALTLFIFQFTLKIISRCAFGNYSSWDPEPTDANSTPDGNSDHESEKMDFTEALAIASESSLIHLITPRWMYKLPMQWCVTLQEWLFDKSQSSTPFVIYPGYVTSTLRIESSVYTWNP